MRTDADLEWEVDLQLHLRRHGAPVAELLQGRGGYVTTLSIDDIPRQVIVSRWLPGTKPTASIATYRLLGGVAARIHSAADTFTTDRATSVQTIETMLDAPLDAMRDLLDATGRTTQADEVRTAISEFVGRSSLDRGVCHADLTLDNVHIDDGTMHVFDLDSAGHGWRAMEPAGVYQAWAHVDPAKWQAWLDGYRTVRAFSAAEESAVPWFALMSDIDNVAWKLGRLRTSVGSLMHGHELREIVDSWLARSRELTG